MKSFGFLALALLAATATLPARGDAPACTAPNTPVTITKAVVPNYPDAARRLNLGPVEVLVHVTVRADGKVVEEHIQKSSNNINLDESALLAGRQSTYAPATVNCRPVDGSYVFRADFMPN